MIRPVLGPAIPVVPAAESRTPPEVGRPFIEVLGETRPRAGPAPPPSKVLDLAPPAQPVRDLVTGALDAEREIDAVLAAARAGQTFSAAELLALQAKVFRYTQAVEVMSRAADRLIGAMKQTLGTQV
jgi:hypothetical protein